LNGDAQPARKTTVAIETIESLIRDGIGYLSMNAEQLDILQ
jgi:hypothetical protein